MSMKKMTWESEGSCCNSDHIDHITHQLLSGLHVSVSNMFPISTMHPINTMYSISTMDPINTMDPISTMYPIYLKTWQKVPFDTSCL